ncbi:histidine kinase [Streptomyces cinnamoneus]|uniref:histidine kinase n=1 Tax=Streptomyces cinnamoneus TaxID=53446 RepID=A0A2G1XPJ6_STRCJ|nr:nitrate- and nitrite sensing domain-containing protein [Streptomyces cinnamoneus]PHQ53140.1 histidine kinase [Streptomyces cinnamoneus]PPT12230.1 HAMP domain-containing protein [Streptomyces cinnamoneus]
MRFRGKSIRRKIVALLLVPLVSLTSLWAFATAITGSEALQLLAVADATRKVGYPTESLVRALQKERRQTLVLLADTRRADVLAELRAQQRNTDKMIAAFRSHVDGDVRDVMSADATRRFHAIEKGLDGIEGLRRQVEDGTIARHAAFAAYNDLVDPHYDFLDSLSVVRDSDIDRQGRALIGIVRAREAVAREDALLAAAFADGTMSRQDLRAFSDRVAERNVLYSTNLAVLPAGERKIINDYWRTAHARALVAAEDTVILAGAQRAAHSLEPQRWQATVTPVLDDLSRMATESGQRYGDRVEPVALGILGKAAVAGVLGLAALVASLVISFRVGRGLVRDLRRLRKEAHEVSGVRLPSVMRRLAAGEQIDVEAEAPRLAYGPDELGQVGQALNTLQRAAVEAAVKQADMRRGVSDVFVNLARRAQVLLHRQLNLLDTMERRTEDTGELADLFRLDHLTTRMRRHAEGLVILSGAAPSRQWRKPIRLMDVVRAAVAEVEDYERIEVRRLPRLALSGPAVSDLTHLLAELLENATVFSPPHTAVQVHGERVSNGFALEIDDRGLGMTPEALLEANLRLAETPEFELSDTDRLGLFVVSRLAQRQGVRVSLQPSPYGGTTAVVLIPSALLIEAGPGAADEDTGSQVLPPHARPAAKAVGPGARQAAPDGPAEPASPHRRFVADPGDGAGGEGVRSLRGLPAPPVAAGEEHHQAADTVAPLPRRRPPALVSENGRTVTGRPGPAGPPAAGPEDERTPTGGLPRRVRQASLAPQLKDSAAAGARTAPQPGGPAAERDAEEVRARMAALQQGWRRGREDNGTTNSPSTAAPGTTTEGDGR